jgi:protein-S-isoprenylcysteine O-methyltransferase Ste14
MPLFNVPVARTFFYVIVMIWLLLELRQSRKTRAGAAFVDANSREMIRVLTIAAIVVAVACEHNIRSLAIRPSDIAIWSGLIAMTCGVMLRFWSFHTLGQYFTFTVQTSMDQEVVSSGPYRVLRHPSYAGIMLIVIGWGFVYDNWASLIALVAGVGFGIVNRIRVEEVALSRDLGGRYQAYAASRKRMIPFIW